jgi:hypothetical protein
MALAISISRTNPKTRLAKVELETVKKARNIVGFQVQQGAKPTRINWPQSTRKSALRGRAEA